MKDLGKFTLRIAILFVILVIVDVVVGMAFSSFRGVAYRHNKYSDLAATNLKVGSDYLIQKIADRSIDVIDDNKK